MPSARVIESSLTICSDVTLSSRISAGHSEPSYTKDIQYELRNDSGIFDGTMVARWTCRNCASWDGGSMDFNFKNSSFIYAVGPDDADLNSNEMDAGLRRHRSYGKFTMNLLAAQGDPANFPADLSKNDNATASGGITDDHDYGSSAHAFIMACVFVIIFPFGAAYLRLQSSVKWHWVAQAIGIVGALIGTGIALNISQMYNRVSTERQILETLLTFILVETLQFLSPGYRPLRSSVTVGPSGTRLSPSLDPVQKDTPSFSTLKDPSRPRTPGDICWNCEWRDVSPRQARLKASENPYTKAYYRGFSFASAPHSRVIGYGLLILFVAFLIAAIFLWKIRRDQRKAPYQTTAAQNFQSACKSFPVIFFPVAAIES